MDYKSLHSQIGTPILKGLRDYARHVTDRFHTPGHKGGKGAHPLLWDLMGGTALDLDLGLAGGLDNLQEPTSWIAKAQDLAAELYAADRSFFLVNGSTCGVQAMIMSTVGAGEKIILSRNSHRSAAGGVALAGCIPIFVMPEFDFDIDLSVGVTAREVENTIRLHPDAKAVFLTNPTYHGVAIDLENIVNSAHSRGIPVIVDEAHGSHLRFGNQLPISAMDAGADLCVQSTHKSLGSLTQSSILHSRGTRIEVARLRSILRILQSTSPNCLLLASLDIARLQMAIQGVDLIAKVIRLATRARDNINSIYPLYCFGEEKIGAPGIFSLDTTKLTVSTKALGLSGKEMERLLRENYGIQPELSDISNLLFMLTIGDSDRTIARLVIALKKIVRAQANRKPLPDLGYAHKLYSRKVEQVIIPREAVFSKRRRLPLMSALGEVSADMLTIYPPGIPVLWPGERIDDTALTCCRIALEAGASLIGMSDSNLDVVS